MSQPTVLHRVYVWSGGPLLSLAERLVRGGLCATGFMIGRPSSTRPAARRRSATRSGGCASSTS